MSTLEKKALAALKDIRELVSNADYLDDVHYDYIKNACDTVLKEHAARIKRLGEKENLSKDKG